MTGDEQLLVLAAEVLARFFERVNIGDVTIEHDDDCPCDDTCECDVATICTRPANDVYDAIAVVLRGRGISFKGFDLHAALAREDAKP